MRKINLIKAGLFISIVVVLLFFSVSPCLAQESELPVLKTKPETIAIFKSGLGFFIRKGEITLKDGWGITEYVPRATLGSLWIGSPDKDTILKEAIAFKQEIKKQSEAISIEELLKANTGKKVIITYGEKTIQGKIKSVPDDRLPEKEEQMQYRRSYSYPPPAQPAKIVIIDTKDGEVVLNKNSISKINFPGSYNTKYFKKEKVKRIKFKLDTKKDKTSLSLSYLQKGITWVPSYLVNIEDPKKAAMTMKATVVNDVEDLNDVDLFFVVGYPNFMYADLLSPMAMEESIKQFITSLESGRSRTTVSQFANIQAQSLSYGRNEFTHSLDYGYSAVKGLSGSSEEDFFLYSKKGINLKKGERAYYHIFSYTVDYKHIYKWEIPNTSSVDATGYMQSRSMGKIKDQVWHSIKLNNSTRYPWTTAPVLVVKKDKPLAQDMINYTPKGAKTDLKLTIAIDIKTDRQENETDRKRDVKLYHRSYDLVTVKGELYIKNLKNKDIDLEINKKLVGEVIKTSHKGKVKKIAEGLKGVNYNSNITWEVPLKAGKELNITYMYKIYVYR